METIKGGRQTGKTSKAIKIAAEKFAYIICRSHKESSRIAQQAREMELDIPFPISYDELLGRQVYGKGIRGYVFDDVKDFLHYIAQRPIFAAVWEDEENQC